MIYNNELYPLCAVYSRGPIFIQRRLMCNKHRPFRTRPYNFYFYGAVECRHTCIAFGLNRLSSAPEQNGKQDSIELLEVRIRTSRYEAFR